MSYAFVVATACLVSIDAFVGGFALSLRGNLNIWKTVLIGLVAFVMCVPAAFLGGLIGGAFEQYVTIIGAAIFFVVGVVNIFSFRKEVYSDEFVAAGEDAKPKRRVSGWLDCLLVGVAVGFDAAVANLSISMMGNSSIWVCVIFAVAHLLFVGLNLLITKISVVKYLKRVFWLPGTILIGMAIYKIVTLFV